MRRTLLTLSITTALTILTPADGYAAKTLVGLSDWVVNEVAADQGPAYCTLARQYQENSTVTFAKNAKGEGTIAFDFGREVFNPAKAYSVSLDAGGVARQYTIKPASQSVMIMRTGADQSLFDAMERSGALNANIQGQAFTVNLDGYGDAFANLNNCVGGFNAAPVRAQNETPRPPQTNQVKDQEMLSAQDARVDRLMADNVALVQKLEDERQSFRARLAEEQTAPNQPASSADSELVQKLVETEKRNTQLLRQISALEAQLQTNQANVNPDVSAALQNSEGRVSLLEDENKRLKLMLDEERTKRVDLQARLETIKAGGNTGPSSSEESAVVTELNAQIQSLQAQNEDLRVRLDRAMAQEPEVIVKEVVKEVPVAGDGTPANVAAMAEQLAEAETSALSLKAERDEYRALLQRERQRLKEAGDLGQQIETANSGADNMTATIRQLEAEKVDLMRQLEFARTNPQDGNTSSSPAANNSALEKRLGEVMQESEAAKQQLRLLADEKQALRVQLDKAQQDVAAARQAAASKRVSQIADADATSGAEMKSLQAEIAALEAQNQILREDALRSVNQSRDDNANNADAEIARIERQYQSRFEAMERENIRLARALNAEKLDTAQTQTPSIPSVPVASRQAQPSASADERQNTAVVPVARRSMSAEEARQGLRNKVTGRPINTPETVRSAPAPTPAPTMQTVSVQSTGSQQAPQSMTVLSGDEIKRLVMQSNIPLASPIERVAKVSGPDFAAFRWDTGTVFGGAEQTKLSNPSAFDKSVAQYIAKTQSRCVGSFDKTAVPVSGPNGLTAQAVDIACVQNGDSGAAASVLFFAYNGMFYAVAHEADLDTFQTAMQMRDTLASNLSQIF